MEKSAFLSCWTCFSILMKIESELNSDWQNRKVYGEISVLVMRTCFSILMKIESEINSDWQNRKVYGEISVLVMLNLFQHLNENRIWTKFRLTNFLHPHKFWYWFLQLPLPFRHPPFDCFVPRNDRAWGKKTKKPIFSDRLFKDPSPKGEHVVPIKKRTPA